VPRPLDRQLAADAFGGVDKADKRLMPLGYAAEAVRLHFPPLEHEVSMAALVPVLTDAAA
jgi:hypothetical protein